MDSGRPGNSRKTFANARPASGLGIFADQLERARGRMFEDEIGRRPPGVHASAGLRGRVLPDIVYHGTSAVLDRFPSGWSNWFTWNLDVARLYSRSIPGQSLIYKYGVVQRSDHALLVLRNRGEFAKSLDRLVAEQSKTQVDGWIELGPGASLMLASPAAYLEFHMVMGLIPDPEAGAPRWTPWKLTVAQIEEEARHTCRFPRGHRGPGSRGAHDRFLAQEIARRLIQRRAGGG